MTSLARRIVISNSLGWREGAILVACAWLVPFLVHAIPVEMPRPLGVYLLPIFWTTYVAVYFYGALPGLAVGLVAPLANCLLTGLPGLSSLGLTALEVALFALIAAGLLHRWPTFWVSGLVAWLFSKALVILFQWSLPAFAYAESPVAHWLRSTQNGLVGLDVLAVIGWLLAAFFPKGGPKAAS